MLKKILTVIYIVVLLMFVYFFQIFVIDTRTLFGVKPNLILISTIVVSLWYGIYTGTFYGFAIGLVTDMMFGNTFGMFTITYTLTGMLIGALNYNYRKENKMSLVYVTLIATTCFEILQYIQYTIITTRYNSILYLTKQIFISSILNIIIVYIIYGLVSKIVEYFDSNLRKNSNGF
ncbi:MAG: rod shape-determining protein MreD [Clostridia bacterium]